VVGPAKVSVGTIARVSTTGVMCEAPPLRPSVPALPATALTRTGHKLLVNMGWNPGHGIGPRRYRALRADDLDTTEDDENAPAAMYLLPPPDAPVLDYAPKDNLFGLGFDALKHAPEFAGALSSAPPAKALIGCSAGLTKGRPRRKRRGTLSERRDGGRRNLLSQEFDDEDADLTVDASLGRGAHTFHEYSERRREKAPDRSVASHSKTGLLVRTIDLRTHMGDYLDPKLTTVADVSELEVTWQPQRCHDGRPPLAGFVLAQSGHLSVIKWCGVRVMGHL